MPITTLELVQVQLLLLQGSTVQWLREAHNQHLNSCKQASIKHRRGCRQWLFPNRGSLPPG